MFIITLKYSKPVEEVDKVSSVQQKCLKFYKNLYKSIKDELTNSKSQPMNESFEKVINSTPSTGSAVNLIESKTYENPQFLRMKDLMAKIK